MKRSIRAAFSILALATIAVLVTPAASYSDTQGNERREERRDDRQGARDTRQEGREAARDAKDECKDAEGNSRADCRQQKRQDKQDARDAAIRQCGSVAKTGCMLYAVDDAVIWKEAVAGQQ